MEGKMTGRYASHKDLAELALYRRLAEINGRLDALKAIEAIEDDIRRNNRFAPAGETLAPAAN
jgi:hypothetical protein